MKISEILTESDDEGSTHSTLIPVLDFLKGKSEDKSLKASLKTDTLVDLVRNAGDQTFTYATLVGLIDSNPEVKSRIVKFSPEEVTIKSNFEKASVSSDSDSSTPGKDKPAGPYDQSPEDIVDNMAKKAGKKRK